MFPIKTWLLIHIIIIIIIIIINIRLISQQSTISVSDINIEKITDPQNWNINHATLSYLSSISIQPSSDGKKK